MSLPKGYCYVCATCAERLHMLGALITHVRELHKRQLNESEFRPITSRQATQLALQVRRLAKKG